LEAAARRGITIESITPKQAKKTITGSGAADKIQMQRAIVFELALDRIPEPADVADAMAIALCLHHRRWTTPEEVQ
jgi:crossover junction endodeoxyribonuclease RuvC